MKIVLNLCLKVLAIGLMLVLGAVFISPLVYSQSSKKITNRQEMYKVQFANFHYPFQKEDSLVIFQNSSQHKNAKSKIK